MTATTSALSRSPDVVVVGAGIVGAACALAVARSGHRVLVLDRSGLAAGSSSAGEGNLLVSDKPAGPELALALTSLGHWAELAAYAESETGRPGGGFELEHKGGLMVAQNGTQLSALRDLVHAQAQAGVNVTQVAGPQLRQFEPELAHGLAGGAYYPQDAQLQPMLATAVLLELARRLGASVRSGARVTGLLRAGARTTSAQRGDRVTGVELAGGERISADFVVNATGTWAAELAAMAGVELPVEPRRGLVLVTQPLPPVIRHKVYSASYLGDVASNEAALASSAVVEGTPSGTVLIGASRERVGFDPAMPMPVIRRLGAQAVSLFPVLAQAKLLRTYRGYRPYSADHLPLIGEHPAAPGLVHACGHEGAGVVLAAATGQGVSELISGVPPTMDLNPFRPGRFSMPHAVREHVAAAVAEPVR